MTVDEQWENLALTIKFADLLPDNEAFLVLRDKAAEFDPDIENPAFNWLMAHIHARFIAKDVA